MEPYISEESKAYVHHLIVFSCNGLDESTDDLGPGGDCYSSESSIGIQSCRANGGILFGAWAVGGEVQVYICCCDTCVLSLVYNCYNVLLMRFCLIISFIIRVLRFLITLHIHLVVQMVIIIFSLKCTLTTQTDM